MSVLFIKIRKFYIVLTGLVSLSFFSQNFDSAQINTQEYQVSETTTLVYPKPRISEIYKKVPKNIVGTVKNTVAKNTYGYSLAAFGSTLALLPADPTLIREARKLGEKVGFNADHTYSNLGPLKIIPGDAGSFVYFLGNGTTFILIGTGLTTYGLMTNDYRSQSTSMQLLQSILLCGVFSQSLKRITGRESPFETLRQQRKHSEWTFLPSFSGYQKNTSKYDAMPSGHLTTGIAAWVILAENYPEKKWIKPLGFALMGIMSFEMIQSGVHWASDYPIAILLGYLIGKNVVKNAVTKKIKNGIGTTQKKYKFNITASNFYGIQVAGATIDF